MSERSQHLELSVSLPTWYDASDTPPSWAKMREVAQQAEAIGLGALFVADHTGWNRPEGPGSKFWDVALEFWDGWALLPALAAISVKSAIGPLVAVPSVRHPVALARMAATLDEVSGGRLILGLGAGGSIERTWRFLGIPTDRLYARFDEAVSILIPLLRDGAVDFAGEHFVAHAATLGPAGPRGGHIPIWIGGRGPRMMRLAALWADAVNFNAPLTSPEESHALIAQFEDVCREVGRDPATIQKTGYALISFAALQPAPVGISFGALGGGSEEIAAQLHAFHRAGIDHLSLYIDAGDPPTWHRTLPITTPAAWRGSRRCSMRCARWSRRRLTGDGRPMRMKSDPIPADTPKSEARRAVYVYHTCPPDMVGTTLSPLNALKTLHPALYARQVATYAGREAVLASRIPALDILWNGTIPCIPPSSTLTVSVQPGREL